MYCWDANKNIMAESEGILKFDNKQLYIHDNLKEYVSRFIDKLKFRFIGVTRFDIAFDFQKFYMDFDPQWFIRKFVQNKIIKVQAQKFGTFATTKNNVHVYETLNFGSKHSNINCKLYNKTEEQKFNRKPWIIRQHQEQFKDQTKDVWRLEFSLYSMTAFLKSEGKDFKFHSLDILDLPNMYGIFMGLFKKYFRFKKYDKNQKRLNRMEDMVLWIFDLESLKFDLIKVNPMIRKSSRSERIFIKKLDMLNKEIREFDDNFDFTAKEFISKIINMHSLEEWANDNNISYDGHEDYIDNIYEFKKLNNEENLNAQYKNAIKNVGTFETFEFEDI